MRLLLVLVLCLIFVIVGCASVYRATEDYKAAMSDSVIAPKVRTLQSTVNTAVSAHNGTVVGGSVSAIVGFFYAIYLWRRKSKGG